MSTEKTAESSEDFASVSVNLPVPADELYIFICDIERFLRINPYLEIKNWKEEAKGKLHTGKLIKADLLNEMNGLRQALVMSVGDVQAGKSFSLKYDVGLKQSTLFAVEFLTPYTSRLSVKEIYPAEMSASEKEKRLNEVDNSLLPWGEAIHSYFMRRKRWSFFPYFNWLQNVFWMKMSPRHRRISRLIIWTTVLEFVVFIFVFAIYWTEIAR